MQQSISCILQEDGALYPSTFGELNVVVTFSEIMGQRVGGMICFGGFNQASFQLDETGTQVVNYTLLDPACTMATQITVENVIKHLSAASDLSLFH